MNDEWYYRIGDAVQGPVSFATLVRTYATGTLKSEDSIQRKKYAGWIAVGSYRPIVDAKDAYLDQLRAESSGQQVQTLEPGGIDAARPELARSDDRQVASHSIPTSMEDSVQMQDSDEDTVIHVPVDQDLSAHPWFQFLLTRMSACQLCLPGWEPSLHTWFILCNDKQTGPFSLMQLVALARDGQLRATDWIGCAEAGRWGPLDPSSEPPPIPPPMAFAPQPQMWMPPYGGYLDPMMMVAPAPVYFSPEEPEVEEPQPTGREKIPLKLPEPDYSPMVAVKQEAEERKDDAANSKNDAALIAGQLLRQVQSKRKKTVGTEKKSGGWSLGARKAPAEEAAATKPSAISTAAPQRAASANVASSAGSRSLASNQLALLGIAAVVIGAVAAFYLLS